MTNLEVDCRITRGELIDAVADALHVLRDHYALTIRNEKGRWITEYKIVEEGMYEIAQVLPTEGAGTDSQQAKRKKENDTREILNGSARSLWKRDGMPGSIADPATAERNVVITSRDSRRDTEPRRSRSGWTGRGQRRWY